MAKKSIVRIRGVHEVQNNLIKFINNAIKDKEFLEDVAKETVDQIRNRTRGRLEEYKQRELTEMTKASRQVYLDNFGGKGTLSRPKVSNLTLSGQLLDSIRFRINQATALITLFLEDERFRNRLSKTRAQLIHNTNFTGSKQNKARLAIAAHYMSQKQETKTNNQIMNDLEKRNRRFLFISDKLNSLLESKIAQNLRRQLSLYNKLKRKLNLK